MDLDPTEDQRELQAMIARFAEDRFPIDVVRTWGAPEGFSRPRWRELAELGTFAITVAEERGGTGLRPIDEVLVHETLGAALVPGPVIAAALGARVLDGVADGAVVPAVLDGREPGPHLVEHLRDADVLVVLTADDVREVDAAEVEASLTPHPTDPTTPVVSSARCSRPRNSSASPRHRPASRSRTRRNGSSSVARSDRSRG
jgi:hypothetical protein